MKFAIFLGIFFIIANAYIPNANAFSVQEMATILQRGSGDDREECAKTAVKVVADEDSGSIGDFHEKSDFEKIKALHKEVMRMMKNGNRDWRSFARIYTIMEEELGGEDAFMDSYFGNYTVELAKGTLNSTVICMLLGNTNVFYNQAKENIGLRIGTSDKFWPMIKDMMTSADLKNKDIRENPTVFFAVGNIMTFGLPDEIVHRMTRVMQRMPEERFRQKVRELGPVFKPFPFNNQG